MRFQRESEYITYLLKCAVNSETPEVPIYPINWDIVFDLAKKHKIISTLYFAIIKLPEEYKNTITHIDTYISIYKKNIIFDTNRSYELERLQLAFQTSKIDYILLKGSVLKNYYPDTAMRHMNDIDILFRGTDSKTVDTIFSNLGYKVIHRGAKDTAYINPLNHTTVEMHHTLIDAGYTDWCQYLKNIWNQCTHKDYEYKMPLEDFYIYHIIHMAKHFKNGGIGLTHILDIHVMVKNFTSMNAEYINAELFKLGLHQFNNAMASLAEYWFGSHNYKDFSVEELKLIASYILSGGAFGSKKQQEANTVVARGDKKLSLRKKIFPDITTMTNYYGAFLNKHKYLLPLFWIKLNCTRLFHFKAKKNSLQCISSVSESRISTTKEIMELCGLNKK